MTGEYVHNGSPPDGEKGQHVHGPTAVLEAPLTFISQL